MKVSAICFTFWGNGLDLSAHWMYALDGIVARRIPFCQAVVDAVVGGMRFAG